MQMMLVAASPELWLTQIQVDEELYRCPQCFMHGAFFDYSSGCGHCERCGTAVSAHDYPGMGLVAITVEAASYPRPHDPLALT